MALDPKKVGGFLRGLARIIENPEDRDVLIARMVEIAKRTGKAAALEALEKSGAAPEVIAAARADLNQRFPD